MAQARELPPLGELFQSLAAEGIRFQVVGMAAAVMQGVPAMTLDTDIWVDLPRRQYLRPLNICRRLGGAVRAGTVAALRDDSLVNFIYSVDGLRSFDWEWKRATQLKFHRCVIRVLPLRRILRSKLICNRPKDIAHVPVLRQTIALQRKLARR